MLTKALTSFSDRLPKNGKRKTHETVSTQELCKYLVCFKQCCWQGGQIFSCWLLWTFDPNSPPRIPEHTTSKSNSMTTDYFLINLIMNYTNNKFTNIQRNVDKTHWDFEPNQSIKVSNWVEVGQGSNRYWRIQNYGSPVLDCRQCTENSLVVVNVKRHGDRNVKYREWLVGFPEGFCQFCPWLLLFFLCALPLLITIIISGHDQIFTICDFCLDIKLYSWCFWPQISFLPQLNWFLTVTGSSPGDSSKEKMQKNISFSHGTRTCIKRKKNVLW